MPRLFGFDTEDLGISSDSDGDEAPTPRGGGAAGSLAEADAAVDADVREFAKTLGVDMDLDDDLQWVVREAFSSALPPNWTEHSDDEGRIYFHNQVTNESSWAHPMDSTFREVIGVVKAIQAHRLTEAEVAKAVQEHLNVVHMRVLRLLEDWSGPYPSSESGHSYYYNKTLEVSTWDDPVFECQRELELRQRVLRGCLHLGGAAPGDAPGVVEKASSSVALADAAGVGANPRLPAFGIEDMPQLQLGLSLASAEGRRHSAPKSPSSGRLSTRSFQSARSMCSARMSRSPTPTRARVTAPAGGTSVSPRRGSADSPRPRPSASADSPATGGYSPASPPVASAPVASTPAASPLAPPPSSPPAAPPAAAPLAAQAGAAELAVTAAVPLSPTKSVAAQTALSASQASPGAKAAASKGAPYTVPDEALEAAPPTRSRSPELPASVSPDSGSAPSDDSSPSVMKAAVRPGEVVAAAPGGCDLPSATTSSFGLPPMSKPAAGASPNGAAKATGEAAGSGEARGEASSHSSGRACSPARSKAADGKGECARVRARSPQEAPGGFGALQVTIVAARGLLSSRKTDPYCVCEFAGKPGSSFKTEVVENCLDPSWGHSGELVGFAPGDSLDFAVYDQDYWARHGEPLGRASVSSSAFHPGGFKGEVPLADTGAVLTVEIAPACLKAGRPPAALPRRPTTPPPARPIDGRLRSKGLPEDDEMEFTFGSGALDRLPKFGT